MLKPQDVSVTIQLLEPDSPSPTYASLATDLKLSQSEAHSAVSRAVQAGLLASISEPKATMPVPVRRCVSEFFIHGLKYIWPAKRGAVSRGIPTASSFPPLTEELGLSDSALPIVWANPNGSVRGETIEPLYSRAPEACEENPFLYHWLALLDIVRLRTGREADLAARAIFTRLQ